LGRDDGHRIERTFRFRNFQEALGFIRMEIPDALKLPEQLDLTGKIVTGDS
jgi:hypothetical protein